MRPALAVALLSLAGVGTPLPPLPRGFMRLLNRHGRESEVPCFADEHAPRGGIWHVDPFGDGRVALIAHPSGWAELGAHNLASAYRPEVP